jgi:arylsulfatase A-like enzyme
MQTPTLQQMNAVAGKPAYVAAKPPVTEDTAATFRQMQIDERETLLAVDDAIEQLFVAIEARGELDSTVVIVMSDNGYLYGEHRLEGKRYPYEASIGVPLAVYTPWATASRVERLISNVDLAPTIAELGAAVPTRTLDGTSFAPALRGQPMTADRAVYLHWGGDVHVPAWSGVRTLEWTYVRNEDGTEELYLSRTDPLQLRNLAGEASWSQLLAEARETLEAVAPVA